MNERTTDEFWDVSLFNRANLPLPVASLRGRRAFSEQRQIRVLDLPIRMPGLGQRLPAELTQFGEMIDHASWVESTFGSLTGLYGYITVDQRPVQPGTTQRREGCHSDAYITDDAGVQLDVTAENRRHFAGQRVERTYICYDCLPTQFFMGPFSVADPSDCDAVQRSFDEQAADMEATDFDAYTVLMLTPYDVHAALPNPSSVPIERTFVKIAISRHQYNREGNSHNDLFDYDWEIIPRTPGKREHRYIETGSTP